MIKGICSNCGKERFLRDNLNCTQCSESINKLIIQIRHELETNTFYFTKEESNMYLYGTSQT